MYSSTLFDLTDKNAIVTGGSGELGKQIAIGLAEAGANVIVCSRNIESCKKVEAEINANHGNALAKQVDVTDPVSIDKLVTETIAQFGTIDILVNGSGITGHVCATEMSLKTWSDIIETNLTGVFLMCQRVGKIMIENGYGKIINISSVAGLRGYDPENHNSVAYTSSKGGVHTLTKDLAVKWGRHGVHVNAIAPGIFLTNMNRERIMAKEDVFKSDIPLAKFGGNRDLIGSILFFGSKASDFCTGQILAIDGGSSSK